MWQVLYITQVVCVSSACVCITVICFVNFCSFTDAAQLCNTIKLSMAQYIEPRWHCYKCWLYFSSWFVSSLYRPSVLWRCWLGGRKGIRPVKIEWWCAGVVICLEQGADLHMAQLMPLPLTVSCSSKIGFTFLVLAHLGSPGKRAVKRVCIVCYSNKRIMITKCCSKITTCDYCKATAILSYNHTPHQKLITTEKVLKDHYV